MHKSIRTKDWKWGIIIETFPKSCKGLSKVYNNGFHTWTTTTDFSKNYSLVIHLFRIIVWFPSKNNGGDNNKE